MIRLKSSRKVFITSVRDKFTGILSEFPVESESFRFRLPKKQRSY